ncbi:vWA domain-containing protein [Nitrospira sp. M1]
MIRQVLDARLVSFFISAMCVICSPFQAFAVPLAADVIVVVDESGSMAGEHSFLQTAIPDLEMGLQAAGVGTGSNVNRYAIVGYGGFDFTGQLPHSHQVGGGDFGSASQFATAASGLVTSGGTEDGYQAIDFALNNYTFRNGDFAQQVILVTDEDRDINNGTAGGNNAGSGLNFSSVESDLQNEGVVLNAILDNPLSSAGGARALGLAADGTAFTADGTGGFMTSAGGIVGNGSGSTETDYVPLAHNLGGAVWDLNLLRQGGNTAESFANAFVSIKVQEIVTIPPPGPGPGPGPSPGPAPAPVPEPGTVFLLGTGLVGLGFWKYKKGNDSAS